MNIELECVDRMRKGEIWLLKLKDERVILRDANDTIVLKFPAEEARKRFQMPSFSQSVKYFGLEVNGRLAQFRVDRQDLERVKGYLHRQTVAAGPDEVDAVLKRAIRDTVIGAVCFLAGLGGIVLDLLGIDDDLPGGKYLSIGITVMGAIGIGKGIFAFVEYGKLRRLQDESDYDDEDARDGPNGRR
jgi:hypothetical protein